MFIWQTLPTWFSPSAWQLRITAISSTQRGDFGIPIADPNAGLAVLGELSLRGQQRRVGRLAHRGDGPLEARRAAACRSSLFERRLRIEQVDMARPAVEEAPDHAFGRAPETAAAWGRSDCVKPSRRGDCAFAGQERSQRQGAEARAGAGQKIARANVGSREMMAAAVLAGRQSTYRNSLEFSIAWQKSTIAAACAGGIGCRKTASATRFFHRRSPPSLDGRRIGWR